MYRADSIFSEGTSAECFFDVEIEELRAEVNLEMKKSAKRGRAGWIFGRPGGPPGCCVTTGNVALKKAARSWEAPIR